MTEVQPSRLLSSRLLLYLCLASTALSIGAVVRTFTQERATQRALRELQWQTALASVSTSAASVEPAVATIQFIKRGFSVEFDSVQYTAEGLRLSGFIGNPTHLTVSQVAIRFAASQRPLSPSYEDYMKGQVSLEATKGWVILPGHIEMGHGESAPIAALYPGTRAAFQVTVPNVKQSSDGFLLEASFTGTERYSY